MWRDFIIDWHKTNKASTLSLNEWPLFENKKIKRMSRIYRPHTVLRRPHTQKNKITHKHTRTGKLNLEGRQAVIDHLISEGLAEWEDPKVKLRAMIFFKSLDDWAAAIYNFASENLMIGDIFTLYELRCGEDQKDASFYEMNEATFRRAVKVLQDDGRAKLFQLGGEEGIKFFDLA